MADLLKVLLIIIHLITGRYAAQILVHSICVVTAALVKCMAAAQSLIDRGDGHKRVIKPVCIWLYAAGDKWKLQMLVVAQPVNGTRDASCASICDQRCLLVT